MPKGVIKDGIVWSSTLLCVMLVAAVADIAAADEHVRAEAASPRVITHQDLWLMPRVGAPTVSPDGRLAVFTVSEPSYARDEQRSDLWLVQTDGRGTPRRLTATSGGESSVEWSPDSGRLVFSARREGDDQPQLYLLDLRAGGEAQRLTSLTLGAREPRFSPDGRRIAFSGRDYPGVTSVTSVIISPKVLIRILLRFGSK